MRTHNRFIRGTLSMVLASVATMLIHAAPAAAATPPAECYADNGQLVVPEATNALPGQYDWTLTLNFNHQADSKYTRGCFAIRTAGIAAVKFVLTTCPIANNVQGASIGNGQGEFDGNLVIRCSLANVVDMRFGASAQYDKFSVHSKLLFKHASYATLAKTKDMSFVASADESGYLGAASTYGPARISDVDHSKRIFGKWVSLDSVLLTTKSTDGYHVINRLTLPAQPGASFFLDHTDSIQIGAVGEQFILNELIIDPGTRCCRPS